MARISASSSAGTNSHIAATHHIPTTTTPTSPTHEEDISASLISTTTTTTSDDLPETDWQEDVIDTTTLPMDTSLFPGGSRDLSYIGLQAFFLGSVFAAGISCTIAAISLLETSTCWWRLPAFATALSIFHFLEFYTTARYNTTALRSESFLLFNNGRAYNLAHGCATVEVVVSQLFPGYGRAFVSPVTIAVGVGLILVGQGVRSFAMAQAGPSFNHVVAREYKETHKLVTHGIYAIFRHPSYFGFFYWAIGTQLLVGNKVCLVGYVLVLWKFFSQRIEGEEKFLVSFFGDKYVEYREKTGTKIPFIQ